MKKANLLVTSMLSLGLLAIYSCQDPTVEGTPSEIEKSSQSRLVEDYGLKKLSDQEARSLLKSKNAMNFKSFEEAEEYILAFKEMGSKGIHFNSKVKPSALRTSAAETFSVNIFSGKKSANKSIESTLTLKELATMASRGPEVDEDEPGSTSMTKDFGFFAEAMVSLVWGDNYSSPTAGVSVSSPGNTTTWTTTQSQASYSSNDGFITYTIYGQMTNNFTVGGVGYSQSYNGTISGEYHPASGQSAMIIEY
ncbi:hypothetical protein [Dyadobacter tibetensis]|uniref:hypothetical protein n=1 Tax=Dyadobacter tibetensis TaxID=1211851 RepID=UPI000472EC53|nr:hypothetical protein [Dyadobacter tibetensis]